MIKINQIITVLAAIVLTFAIATPAEAQLGGLLNKAQKAIKKNVEKIADNTTATQDDSRKSKRERAESLVVLHQEDFKPSKAALAANPLANSKTVPERFSKSYKDLYAAYEHLDSHYFPLQPYYKYPTLYALGEEQLIYPWARLLKEAKKILAFPVGTTLGDITIGLVGYDDGVKELVSADGQKLAMHADELFRYPMAARFFADPNCDESVWNLAMLLAYNNGRFRAVKAYTTTQNSGVADAKRGWMFPYSDGGECNEREALMKLMARSVVDINLIAKCVLQLYQGMDTEKEATKKALYLIAANELYKQVLMEHDKFSANSSKLNKQLMYYTRYNGTPEYSEIVDAAIVKPEPPTMALKPGALDKQLNAQVLRIIRQQYPDIIRVVVINDAWKVHTNGIVPTDRAVMAWAVYRNKKGKLEAHDYSFCQDYQGGGRYGALRYKGVGTTTVYVKQ
ncbi:hypothetical protein [Segatella maculosa]|uniref:Transglycosylase SLT domain-containing protein n=1 Tax=Segatella maculosa OT 289 TaxID=999422 RepID=H1HNM4_9BACT|nr:hypothetical protein [Segatella maculosa]EHO68903.1 hypothetical protein HMPREF9944_01768 [Segatella maculosa OT 289]